MFLAEEFANIIHETHRLNLVCCLFDGKRISSLWPLQWIGHHLLEGYVEIFSKSYSLHIFCQSQNYFLLSWVWYGNVRASHPEFADPSLLIQRKK